MIVYSCADRDSFERVRFWANEVETNAPKNVARVIVCNKIDLTDQRVVSAEEGKQLANELGIEYFEISAKTNVGINEPFQSVVESAVKKFFFILFLVLPLTLLFYLCNASFSQIIFCPRHNNQIRMKRMLIFSITVQ